MLKVGAAIAMPASIQMHFIMKPPVRGANIKLKGGFLDNLPRSIDGAAAIGAKPLPRPLRTIGAELDQEIGQTLVESIGREQAGEAIASDPLTLAAGQADALTAFDYQIAQCACATGDHASIQSLHCTVSANTAAPCMQNCKEAKNWRFGWILRNELIEPEVVGVPAYIAGSHQALAAILLQVAKGASIRIT